MKDEIQDENGRGIRALYRDDLRDERMERPRHKLSRPIGYYLDEKILDRPLFAFHQLARISELLLYKAKFGRRKYEKHLERCEMLFIEVRREQRNILSKYPISKPIPREVTPILRKKVTALLAIAKSVVEDFDIRESRTYCPCCHGESTLTENDAMLLRAVLREAVVAGKLPESFMPDLAS